MNEQIRFQQDVRRYLSMVHRRRNLLILALGLSVLVSLLYSYTTRPVYQATAQILIDHDTPNVLPVREGVDASSGTADYYETQYRLLQGRTLAARVVERLGLQTSPEFATGPYISPWERFRRLLGRAAGPTLDRDGMPLSPAVAAFRARLVVEPIPGSRLVNLRFSAYDPGVAARVVNTLAQLYIEQTLEFRYTTSSEATSWLSERLKDQQAKVEAAERALQSYRERWGLVNVEERQSLVDQRLSAFAGSADAARTERIAKETFLKQVRSTAPAELQAFPLVAASGAVQKLKARRAELQEQEARLSQTLGERHPEMVRLRSEVLALDGAIGTEIRGIVGGVEADYQTALEKEGSLQANLEGAKREALELNRKILELDVLRREVASHKELFQKLMNRTKESGLESELKATNIRVVEKAEAPRSPISPRPWWNLQLALLMGLAVGLGLVLVFEHFDNTLKTPEDVQEQLGLPFLGMVPEVPPEPASSSPSKPAPRFMLDPQSMVAEAYRVVRTNLLFSSEKSSGRILAVTSANPGEGKTTTVANLAVCLADNDARVLVVEADLRRPALQHHFGIAPTPGLTDVIVGKCAAADALQPSGFKRLRILPCGYVPPNPAELLGSRRIKDLLWGLRSQYDFILIDTPPVLNIADASILCPVVDGVVLVVGAELSGRPAIERTIEQIRRVGGKLTGIVLNRVNLKRNAYYYSQYYGRHYDYYYSRGKPKAAAGGAPE